MVCISDNLNTSMSGLAALCNPSVDGWRGNPTVQHPFGVTESATEPADCLLSPCLYDLEKDPAERHNVAATNPSVVMRLLAGLKQAVCAPATCHVDVEPKNCTESACEVLNKTGCFGPHCGL